VSVGLYFTIGYLLFGTYKFATEVPPAANLAIELAERNERIAKEIGTPLTLSYFWGGKSTETELSASLPVSGPNGKGTLVVRAVRTSDGWKVLLLDGVIGEQWLEPFPIINAFTENENNSNN